MSDPVLDIDQHLRAPLALLQGERPPAPAWFTEALAHAPERGLLEVEGAEIEMLTWGERGRPGLLLLHGGRAHANWWDHIAPAFAGLYRVAALSMSGTGRSDWRDRYTIAQHAREMVAVARAAGLYDAGAPVFAAHSFGSRPLLAACADAELAPRAAVVIDVGVSPPDAPEFKPAQPHPNGVYPTLAAALARFRLLPAQVCENLFVLDHIARESLKPVAQPDGGEGWSWRFDPFAFQKVSGASRAESDRDLRAARCPLAVIYGGRSSIIEGATLAYTREIAPAGTPFTCIPEAAHHVFLDHPLEFITALRATLAGFGA